jgi:hypothetical protein
MITAAEVDADVAAALFDVTLDLDRAANRIVALAQGLPSGSVVQALTAVQALGLASTAILACLDERCDLAQPPTSIDSRPRGTNHNLIKRCQHDPPHCWDGTVFIDCPDP